MAELEQITFTYKEVVEALLKHHGSIHEGIWGVYIRFGIKGANMGMSPDDVLPTAILPVLQIGLQRFPEENNLSVDAAKVNPGRQSGRQSKPTSRRPKARKSGVGD